MKVMITAAEGQLGRAMMHRTPVSMDVAGFTRPVLDITDPAQLVDCALALDPQLIINTAAYTAVDAAETDEATAYAVNRDAVAELARVAAAHKARLVHISTDFVFDGTSSTPYAPDAQPAPLSVYGASKLAGERTAGESALIIRTAWVYGIRGRNFVHTMLALMREREEVRVVADQIGTPTFAGSLALAVWELARKGASGIYHFTDSGTASWYDFAVAIMEEALALGLLEREVRIIPIATADYPTPARRPAYAVLDKSATTALIGAAPHWRVNLRKMLEEVAANG